MCNGTKSSATMCTETSTSTTNANGVSTGQESMTRTNGVIANGEGGAAAKQRRCRTSLHHLNKIDEYISGPVFRLGLPKWLELLYSFPANIFGSTFFVMVMPLWIGLLALMEKQSQQQQQQQQYITNNDTSNLIFLKFITIGLTAVYMISWGFYQYGYHKVGMKFIWRMGLYIGGAPWCVAVLAYTVLGFNNDVAAAAANNNNNNNKRIFSMAIYPLFLWPFVILIVNYLKKTTKRHRPAYKDCTIRPNDHVDNKSGNIRRTNSWIDNKKYLAVPYMLAQYNGDAAFPSGDAAMAALFALPIFYIGGSSDDSDRSYYYYYYYKAIASTIIFLSASGRMYVLAHHFLDVTVGIAITYLVHLISSSSFVGFGMYDMEWWYPLLVTFVFFLHQKLTNKTAAGNEAGKNEDSKKKK
jgi:membrane-associated phospholipid phosphatase